MVRFEDILKIYILFYVVIYQKVNTIMNVSINLTLSLINHCGLFILLVRGVLK